MAVNNAVNLVPTLTGTANQIAVTQAAGSSTASIALTSPFFNTSQPLFSAYLSTTQTNVTGDGTSYPVVFDTVLINQTSSYNNATGTFTAPTTGNYMFNTLIQGLNGGASGKILQCYMVLTGVTYLVGWQLMAAGGNSSAGTTIVVPLTAGNTVVVNAKAVTVGLDISVIGGNTPVVSFFNGYLMP